MLFHCVQAPSLPTCRVLKALLDGFSPSFSTSDVLSEDIKTLVDQIQFGWILQRTMFESPLRKTIDVLLPSC